MNLKRIKYLMIIFCATASLLISCGGGGSGGGAQDAVPQTPSGISASEGVYTDRVEIKWKQADGAGYYVLYKSIDNRDQFRAVATDISGLSYTDDKVTPDRIYYYRVASGNGGSWSDPSTEARGYAHKGKPLISETVTASSNRIGTVTITWSVVPQIDSYRVERAESENGVYTAIAEGITSTTYTDTPPARDTTYYYRVIAVSNTEGEGDPCEPVTGVALQDIPAAPAGVNATNGTYSNKVDITWDASLNASTYIVYRAPDSGGSAGVYEKIGENITGTLFEDVTASLDIIYHYSVSAVSSGGESALGGDVVGSRITGAPEQTAAPVNVKASDGNYDTVTITWDAVLGASSYSVYRAETRAGDYSLIAGADRITDTSYADTPPSLVTHYFYRVTSWSTVESYSSVADEGFAIPQIADVPSGVSATTSRTDGTIVISWSASARADSYRIYRSESADGTYNLLASGLTALSFTDEYPSITVGRAYYYRIAAVNVSGESGQSSYVTGNSVLAVPANLAGSYSSDQVTLTWTAVTGATSYRIQRRKTLVASWNDLGTTDQTTYVDSNLSKGVINYYRIQAVNSDTESSYTDAIDVYIPIL